MKVLRSWLDLDPKSSFSLYNIPFGIISTAADAAPRAAIAIGRHALDLKILAANNAFTKCSAIQPHLNVFSEPTLNAFAALGRPMHKIVREYIQDLLRVHGPFPSLLEESAELRDQALVPLSDVTMHLPMHIGDYTDFYAGLHHAYKVGELFRGPQNALQPNYKHLPVGYHGRASSIVVSGTPIRRPWGQILSDPKAEVKRPILSPCKKLDFELELGCFVCKPSNLGEPIDINDAQSYLFGLVLLNDWSARDIQSWEYVPLGPFNSKNFGTTISPWVVLMDALEPFATEGLQNDVEGLPYLRETSRRSHYAIDLTCDLQIRRREQLPSTMESWTVTRTSAKNLLFSFPQMLAHHTIGGCNVRTGDLLGSGTISGPGLDEKGALLERTENGKNGKSPVKVFEETRTFLQDGDIVSMSGVCGSDDYALVGFGECSGRVLPAHESSFSRGLS